MNTRLLVLLLGLLILLFGVGVGLGARQGDGASVAGTPGLVQALGAFRGRAQLTDADMAGATPAACLEQLRQAQLVLPVGGGCIFFIGEARTPVRTLQLAIARGQQAQVLYAPANPERFTARQRLDAQRPLELTVFQEGGELRMICANGGGANACVLAVR